MVDSVDVADMVDMVVGVVNVVGIVMNAAAMETSTTILILMRGGAEEMIAEEMIAEEMIDVEMIIEAIDIDGATDH